MTCDPPARSAARGRRACSFAARLLAVLALSPVVAVAQTPEQVRAFQNLPPAQRAAILQQVGGVGAAAPQWPAQAGEVVVQRPVAPEPRDSARVDEARPVTGGEQVLLELELRDPGASGSAEEGRGLVEFRERVLRGNPYELTPFGALQLPGLAPIELAGLSTGEIRKRLSLDPALRDFTVVVTILRLEPRGVGALRPFGYDLFRDGATAFVPGTDLPVPPEYVLGAGDVMEVQLYGQTSQTYTMPVSRDGTIGFPELGPISVGGLSFGAARNLLENRIRQQMIGTQARVSLSELRSVRVLVLGDAQRPGSYVVSGLSTATNALFASGGVSPVGSLRRIEIKRDGRLLRRLDLYDVLLRGDTSADLRLQTGDAVFVPPVGPTVAIDGEVRRPAIYELLDEHSVAALVDIAGGLAPEADPGVVTVERIGEDGIRRVLSVDLRSPGGRAFALSSGDRVRIAGVRPVVVNGVELRGYVHRPGTHAYRQGLRLTDLIASTDDLRPDADLGYVLIRREDPATRAVSALSVDLLAALRDPGSVADLPLAPRDIVHVFDSRSPRGAVVDPLIAEIERQSGPDRQTAVATVGGRVKVPGSYPVEPGMRLLDLVRAAGGLQDGAYASSAELMRYRVVEGERRRADLVKVDLAAAREGDAAANFAVEPYDVLMIQEIEEWSRVEQVYLAGEVRFPGRYQIRRSETLSSLVRRAGGLTPLAFPEGAVFTREVLRVREREQLDRLAARLQADIAVLALQSPQANPTAAGSLAAGQALLEQLRRTQPVGRLVIDLGRVVADEASVDVMLRGGDRLVVPRLAQEVSVLGEVQNATSHLFHPGMTRDDVLQLSGGTTRKADRGRTYVVRADGRVIGGTSRWFRGGDVELQPGDTVVVPVDAERMRPLPLWTAVTTVIYNLAIAAAAVNSFR